MNPTLILIYAGLLYGSTFFVSFFFGFIKGFLEARQIPFLPAAVSILSYFEWGLEFVSVIGITVVISAQNPQHAFVLGVVAYALATIISYFLDIKIFNGTLREFWTRFSVAYIFCLPIGIFLAQYSPYGT